MQVLIRFEGMDKAKEMLSELEKKQLPYATALALTRTGQDVKADLEAEMKKVFDRPTPYTLGSLFLKPATKSNLSSMVYLREWAGKGTPATKYMSPNIFAQDRNVKRFEAALQRIGVLPSNMYVVPGAGADLDAYGNMSRGQIVQILSYLSAFGEQGYRANMTAKGRARLLRGKRGSPGIAYFVAKPGGRLRHGIYKRTGYSGGSTITPVMIFVRKPTYRSIYRFYEVARRTIERTWEENFRRAMREAMSTAKP
jgi:hypothetical protein